MKPETPILFITLQIPVLPDTNTDEVLDAIGQQVSQALHEIKEQQAAQEREQEEANANAGREMITTETFEALTDETQDDLLSQMGYVARA